MSRSQPGDCGRCRGAGSSPARATAPWTSWLTDSGCSGRVQARLPLVTPRRIGPVLMVPSSIQFSKALTAQCRGLPARGSTTSSGLSPYWLPFERRMLNTSPFGCSATSSAARATSSERRNAPTNPTSNRARSRAPARSGSGPRPRVFQVRVGRTAVEDMEKLGGHERGRLFGWGTMFTTDALPHRQHPGVDGGIRKVAQAVGKADGRQPAAHRAHRGAVTGEKREIPGQRCGPTAKGIRPL
jgi:hypothetical protein